MDSDTPVPAPDASKVSVDSRVIEPAFGLGRFAPFNWERLPHDTGIRLFWGRIVGWLILLACVLWMTVASGLFVFIKYRRGFADVQFAHMVLLPWKLDDYRRSKGEFLIKEGLAKAEAQEWRTAFNLLRPGLLAVPEHREARLLVARIYLMAGRADVTRTTLIDGVKYHGDQLDYLREVLGYFFGLQADDTVIALIDELRPRLEAQAPAARMATTALAYAYFNRGRFVEAEAVLSEARLLGTPESRFVTARVAWAQGRQEDALVQLRDLTAAVPQDYEIYRTLIFYLGEKKRWGEVRRASLQRQFDLPDRPEAYVDFITACTEEGDEAARAEAEEAFFARFARDASALLRLAEQASRAGRVEIVERVAARCRELGHDGADAALLVVGAQLERQAYREVVERCIDLGAAVLKWPERQRLILGGLRGAALYGLGQEAEAEQSVRPLWETRVLPAQALTAVALRLQRVGQAAAARRVLRRGVEIDPLNQPALVLLLRDAVAENRLDEAPGLIERLVEMRQPPVDLVEAYARVLDSDLYLFYPDRERTLAKLKAFSRRRASGL